MKARVLKGPDNRWIRGPNLPQRKEIDFCHTAVLGQPGTEVNSFDEQILR